MSTGMWIVCAIILFVGIIIFAAIIFTQKTLDAPCRGQLIVDKKEENEPAMVYFQSVADPKTFRNGEEIKLKVRVVK